MPVLPLIAAAAPGIISGVANLFGAKRRREQEDHASSQIKQLSDIFNNQLQGSYYDTNEAQGAMTQIEKNQRENNKAITNTGAATGMTDEAKVAMMGKNNEATGNAFSNLSQMADLWRSRLLNQKSGTLQQLFQVGQTNRSNFNNSLQNIVSPLAQSLGASFNAGAFGQSNNK